ncbi:alpha/beta fold hydrolase [Nonomuraea guangzhouensis]|uniref:Alpha/beta fold hydrolase n=1 Tax=Nonomuraea guangzhouensis TaxID=1291555 RepID=A0ABW4GIB0_9ACTN|nr:alpha/beta hydrolase [Nonomuraea guangzhouensis]
MTTFVLIHGGGGSAWDWHLLDAELRGRGHDVVAVDLPVEDESAGLREYAETVVEAIGDRRDLVVVAHSWGGFIGPLVCDRVKADLLVMLTAMIPAPGERPADWWANTGFGKRDIDDPIGQFMHDVPAELAAEAMTRSREHTDKAMREPWPLDRWPDVPTRFLLCRDDRWHEPDFMREVVRARLGITPDEMDGSHAPMLARPKELADRLEGYLTGRS